MNEPSDELTNLHRRLFIIKLLMVLSFSAGVGTTLVFVGSTTGLTGIAGPIFIPSLPGTQTQVQTTLSTSIEVTATTTASLTAATTFSYSATSTQQGLQSSLTLGPAPLTVRPALQQYSGFLALLSWVVFAGTLIWRGHVRSVWGKSRFSYDTFRLLVRMRGAQTRLKLMHSLNEPKNKLQLATALGIDWKAVDRHVHMLERNGMIEPRATSGTAVFYEITEKGRRMLEVLKELSSV